MTKYNTKSWSKYSHIINYIPDEEYELTIRHNNKKHGQSFFIGGDNSGVVTSNTDIGYFQSWKHYKSAEDDLNYQLQYTLTAPEYGAYEIHILYTSAFEAEFPIDFTLDEYSKTIQLWSNDEYAYRRVETVNLQNGTHTLHLNVSPAIYILGVDFRKIDIYKANNKLNSDAKLTLTSFNYSISKEAGADELSLVLLYDNDWKDEQPDSHSLTNFLFDFRDEITLKVVNSKGEMEYLFGGYVSTCTANADETELTMKCAGRLIDADIRTIVEEMCIGHETESSGFLGNSIRRFEDYNEAITYLTDVLELPLHSNLPDIIQNDADKFECISIETTTEEVINKMTSENIIFNCYDNKLNVRNGDGANQTQKLLVYLPEWYNTSPVCLDDYPIFYIKYGLGLPKLENDSSNSSGTSTGSGWNKFGISADGTQIMAIGMPSSGADSKYSYAFYKSVFENKCPHCGASDLVYGWAWAGENVSWGRFPDAIDGKSHRYVYGHNEGGSIEGHVFCANCDADYSCVSGQEHISGSGVYLNRISGPDASSREEARQLTAGNYQGSGTGTVASYKGNIFQDITDKAFKYSYCLGCGCSSHSCLENVGYGDCWAFSELIFDMFTEAGVGARIMQYATGAASNHRSVQYIGTDGQWTPFPYREYGWSSQFNHMLNDTSNQWNGTVIKENKGGSVSNASYAAGGDSEFRYDKDNPFKCWIVLMWSNTPDGKIQYAYIDFTAGADDDLETYSGLVPITLNNIYNCSEVEVINKMKAQAGEREHIYLRGLGLEYKSGKDPLYTTNDSENPDYSTFKMLISEFGFRNGTLVNPKDLGSTGKTVNSVFDNLLESGELNCHMEYTNLRRDDKLIFKKSKSTTPVFEVYEGDNGNIINISNWDYTPTSDYFNRSLVVFKKKKNADADAIYHYVESRKPLEVIQYGEVSNVISKSEDISTQEAYYEARQNLTTHQDLTGGSMTVTVIGYPANLHLNDYVSCVFENSKYNDNKQVKSINVTYNVNNSPKLQTKIGLNKVAPELELKEQFEKERELTKVKKAIFSKTALYSTDDTFRIED